MRVKCTVVDVNKAGNGTYVKLLIKEPAFASGRIEMVIANNVVANQLVLGREYLLEIKAVN